MFLGARDDLDQDLRQAFIETGTIHLLVVSGLNVGILATSLIVILRLGLVPQHWVLGIVAAACVLYAAVTDGEPPVVRATVMVLVACLAMVLARRPLGYNTLALAGLVVLAINPAELFQTGTQLSFLSVGVLVFASDVRLGRRELDPLERLIARTRPWPQRAARRFANWMWVGTLAATLIWLVIAPLVMSRFHLISPSAVLVGPIVSIPATIAMGCGFGIFLFGWLLPPLASLLGWLCDGNLYLMQACVEAARNLPGSHFWVAGPSDWWLAGFYGAVAVAALIPRWRPSLRWTFGLLAAWTSIGLAASLVGARDADRLECTFLSVGHGAAVVVELPGGKTLLYDAGRLGSPAGASRVVSSFLWSRGITHLDAVVISHADADHYNGLPALLDQFSVGAVYVSPVMFEDASSRAVQALREAIAASGVTLSEVWSGDRLRAADDVEIEVLHPPRRGVLGSDNANSIVLAIQYQGRRILLTGDLEPPGLSDVLAELPYDCDVAMAPHHGSTASDPPGFVAWSTPEWTIVSGGHNDRNPEVTEAFTSQGSAVLHTADHGAVSATIAEGQVSVKGFHADE
jgi:competence protein ComEC